MSFEIIDFHTHPFLRPENNICSHQCVCNLQSGDILDEMRALGVSKFCGSVIAKAHKEDKIKQIAENAVFWLFPLKMWRISYILKEYKGSVRFFDTAYFKGGTL